VSEVLERARHLGIVVREGVPLGERTTYRVGGAGRYGVVIETPGDVARVAELVRACDLDVLVLGAGSNLLVSDRGYDGLVVELGAGFGGLERLEGTDVRLGGSLMLPVAARRLAGLQLAGFAWAVGVPGSVGGAVRMNAGGHGGDMARVVRRVLVGDLRRGTLAERDVSELGLGYRTSRVAPDEVVLSALLGLEPGDRAQLEQEMREVVRWRREHQPGGQNAGSVFVNPAEVPAARLIEEAGLRGRRLGSAQVSLKHANFIQADPGGSAGDVAALIELVAGEVERIFGIRLRAEVRLVGFGASRSSASGALGDGDAAPSSA